MTNRTRTIAFKAILGTESGSRGAGEFMAAQISMSILAAQIGSAGFLLLWNETDIAATLDIAELDIL